MRIIQEHDRAALKTANQNSAALPPFRKYTYCDECKVNESLLLYNLVTNEVLLLEKCDFTARAVPDVLDIASLEPICRDYLLSHRFIVSDTDEDFRDVEKLRKLHKLLNRVNFAGFASYTVFTTTACNARCFYCFQKGIKKTVMDEKTANDTADFILRNCERSGKKDVRILWFGGEPLCNDRVMDIISSRLADAGIDYSSMMISNGLLLDAEKCKKAVELWKLKKVQITLDGTEKIYNGTKAYVGGVENAYETVLANIATAINAGIRVVIRLNICRSNIEDMFVLADELAERFTGNLPDVYGFLLYQYNSEECVNERKALEEKLRMLIEKLKVLRLTTDLSNLDEDDYVENGGVRTYQCMADNPYSVVVLPDGRLRSCEQIDDDCFPGSIYTDWNKYDTNLASADGTKSPIEYWSEADIRDECRKCKLYPFCVRLLHCPEHTEACSLVYKERVILRLEKARRHYIKLSLSTV